MTRSHAAEGADMQMFCLYAETVRVIAIHSLSLFAMQSVLTDSLESRLIRVAVTKSKLEASFPLPPLVSADGL